MVRDKSEVGRSGLKGGQFGRITPGFAADLSEVFFGLGGAIFESSIPENGWMSLNLALAEKRGAKFFLSKPFLV